MEDYYRILGVERSASSAEIKKAYHRLARKYHPDSGTGDEGSFRKIREAYETLEDSGKRREYDRKLTAAADAAAAGASRTYGTYGGRQDASSRARGARDDADDMDSAWKIWNDVFGDEEEEPSYAGNGRRRSSVDAEDLWEDTYGGYAGDGEDDIMSSFYRFFHTVNDPFDFFGTKRSGSSRSASRGGNASSRRKASAGGENASSRRKASAEQRTASARRGQDLHATARITAEEAARGCTRKISVHYKDFLNGNAYRKYRVSRSFIVAIPAGISDGSRIRLKDAGKPSEAGGSGNVIVTVRVG